MVLWTLALIEGDTGLSSIEKGCVRVLNGGHQSGVNARLVP